MTRSSNTERVQVYRSFTVSVPEPGDWGLDHRSRVSSKRSGRSDGYPGNGELIITGDFFPFGQKYSGNLYVFSHRGKIKCFTFFPSPLSLVFGSDFYFSIWSSYK